MATVDKSKAGLLPFQALFSPVGLLDKKFYPVTVTEMFKTDMFVYLF